MTSRVEKVRELVLGLGGALLLAIGGTLVMYGLHWIIWNPPAGLSPPSDVSWLVFSSIPLGFFFVGIGLVLILQSQPTITTNA